MSVLVSKFGGTSMANADTIQQVESIILQKPERRYIVVSAPGKRNSDDIKVTDVLLKCAQEAKKTGSAEENFAIVRTRFQDIARGLQIKLDLTPVLDEIEARIPNESVDYTASQGERLMAMVLAARLGFDFIDAAEIIKFDANGNFDKYNTNIIAKAKLERSAHAVIPGFYGTMPDGKIKTFSRGGSDVTGAIIARAAGAEIYENWTDVNGFLTTDPRIVKDPAPISELSYKELRELAYMGANVLHPESIFPVRYSNIPINIRNTFNPSHPGTMIRSEVTSSRLITGIAGKKGFSSILIEKSMMNSEIGFGRKVLSVLEGNNISFEHMPSGIDTLSVIVGDNELKGKLEKVVEELKQTVSPDNLEINTGLALVATVGHGMASRRGTAARLFTALSNAGINIRMIDQGSSELNIIVGINNEDYEAAVNAIYHEFVK